MEIYGLRTVYKWTTSIKESWMGGILYISFKKEGPHD